MAAPPWLKLYPSDWKGSQRIALLSDQAFRIFVELLLSSWDLDGLPEDLSELHLLSRSRTSPREFEDLFREELVAGGFFHLASDGRWRNPRQERDRNATYARQASGRKGGRTRIRSVKVGSERASETPSEKASPQMLRDSETQKTRDSEKKTPRRPPPRGGDPTVEELIAAIPPGVLDPEVEPEYHAWIRDKQSRRTRRERFGDVAQVRRQVKRLSEYPAEAQKLAIRTSMETGYRGLFPDRAQEDLSRRARANGKPAPAPKPALSLEEADMTRRRIVEELGMKGGPEVIFGRLQGQIHGKTELTPRGRALVGVYLQAFRHAGVEPPDELGARLRELSPGEQR